MTQQFKRVIVPLDAASETGPAIDTAAHLAARWRVPLHGVFIEDEELISLARLPFARQVTLGWVARHNEIRGCTTRWESCRRHNTCEQLLGAETRSKSAYLTGMLTVPLRLHPLGARKVLGPTEGRRRWARWRTTRTR